MFANSVTLFEGFGLKIKVNVSWAFIAILIAWSLAQGNFPGLYAGLPTATYWWMGVAGVVGLFASILLHELAHSLVAIAYGMRVKSITLWLLGGVAELADEPPTPKVNFLMAIAGPLMSAALAGFFYLSASLAHNIAGTEILAAVLSYLALLNVIVAVFNMIPALPLDGGHVLRAVLWAVKGDKRYATQISSKIGSWFGLGMVGVGLATVIFGMGMHGLWWVLLGMFIRFAADSTYYHSEISHVLEGKSVSDFMTRDPVTVPVNTTARQFLEDWVYKYYHGYFPVVHNGQLVGGIATKYIKGIAQERLDQHSVAKIMDPCSDANTIDALAPATEALANMQRGDNARLMVVENGALVGIIALKDLLRAVSLRMELEQ